MHDLLSIILLNEFNLLMLMIMKIVEYVSMTEYHVENDLNFLFIFFIFIYKWNDLLELVTEFKGMYWEVQQNEFFINWDLIINEFQIIMSKG